MSESNTENHVEAVKPSRSSFIKGLIAGALAVSVLGGGIGIAHTVQASKVYALDRLIATDEAALIASMYTLEDLPRIEKFGEHAALQSIEGKAFIEKVNKSSFLLSNHQSEIDKLKSNTVFPDLKLKLEEMESTINGPTETSPLGFKDSMIDIALMRDVRYLCEGHEIIIQEGNIMIHNDTDNFVPSLAATVLQIPAGSQDVTTLKVILEAGIETYCPK